MADIKNTAREYLPPVVIGCIWRARLERNLWLNRELLAKNKKIAEGFSGEECFILATGPSIKKQNLEALKGRNCITVSNFFVHHDFKALKPIFHCIAPYHLPITEDAWRNWMLDLQGHLAEGISVVFCVNDFERNDECFKEHSRYYLCFGASEGYIEKNGINLSRALLSPRSVSIQAIQLALGLGFSRIFLLGMDHNYILHYGESKHFYEEAKDSKVKGGYSEWDKSLVEDIGAQFESSAELWKQYRLMKKIAERQNVKIINLTDGGLLDVFERGSFLDFV